MSEKPNAGTTEQPPVSESAGTSGAAPNGSEAADGKPVDFTLAMTWKKSAEDANKLREELAAAKARAEAAEAARSMPATTTADPAAALMAEGMQELQYRAFVLKENAAMLQLAQLQALSNMQQEIQQTRALAGISQQDQPEVQRIMHEARQRGEYLSPTTAQMVLERNRLTSQQADLTRQSEALRQRQEAAERGVVATRPVGIPAPQPGAAEMTIDQWNSAWDSGNEQQRDELFRRMSAGKLTVKAT